MYYHHFGLSGAPFQFTPTAKLFFLSKAHREALTALERRLKHEPTSFSMLIGETGTGKTTLLIALLAQSDALVHSAYVCNPKLGFDGLLHDIARQLGVPIQAERFEMVRVFDRYLQDLAPGERVIVILDEAQAVGDELQGELRLFSCRPVRNLERLHFVFAGDPSLLTRLSEPRLRKVDEGCDTRVLLTPMDPIDSRAYVDYRLAAFGGDTESIFARESLEYLLDRSGGIPRHINVFCHNALLRSYNAGESQVGLESARRASIEVSELLTPMRRKDPARGVSHLLPPRFRAIAASTEALAPALIAATLATAAIGSLYFWNSRISHPESPVSINREDLPGEATIEYPAGASKVSFAAGGQQVSRGAEALAATNRDRLPRRVRVRPGDTLLSIARAYLGTADKVNSLIVANPQIGNIDRIYSGEFLNLPEPGVSPTGDSSPRETADSAWQRVPRGASGTSYEGQ